MRELDGTQPGRSKIGRKPLTDKGIVEFCKQLRRPETMDLAS